MKKETRRKKVKSKKAFQSKSSIILGRFLRYFRDMKQTPPTYKRRDLFRKGDWIDDFGIYHLPRNHKKWRKHLGGWNNNNGR